MPVYYKVLSYVSHGTHILWNFADVRGQQGGVGVPVLPNPVGNEVVNEVLHLEHSGGIDVVECDSRLRAAERALRKHSNYHLASHLFFKGPSTLATLFNHMRPRIVADPSTLGRHVAATCMLCMQTLCLWLGRATACRTLESQTAVCSPKLENNGFLRE